MTWKSVKIDGVTHRKLKRFVRRGNLKLGGLATRIIDEYLAREDGGLGQPPGHKDRRKE